MEQKKILKAKKKSLYNKTLGFLVKKGKKTTAKNLLENVLMSISKKLKTQKIQVLLHLFVKANAFVETKNVKIRNRTFVVPFSLSLKRRSFLTIKWLLKSANENKEKISISTKLIDEIFDLLTKSKSKTLNLKKNNNIQAFSNRSNFHFRW